MLHHYFSTHIHFSRGLTGVLIGALVFMQAPLALYAEELPPEDSSGDAPAEEVTTTQEETTVPATEPETTPDQSSAESEPAPAEESTESEPTEPASDTTVTTGDVAVEASVETSTNINETTIEPGSNLDGSTEVIEEAGEEVVVVDPGAEYEAENTAVVDIDLAAEATSGSGTASGEGDIILQTGDASATANVINVVNANVINSSGVSMLLNALDGIDESLNMGAFELFSGSSGGTLGLEGESVSCALEQCDTMTLGVQTDNSANIVNDVVVRSETGSGDAHSSGGDIDSSTGDAYAAANVMNVVNTNIVDANYLLLTVNSMGDMNGNISFPSLHNFFGDGQSSTPSVAGSYNVNEANVETNLTMQTETGDSQVTGDSESATLSSGSAISVSNIYNLFNQNIIGNDSFNVLIRVHGDWNGSIIGSQAGLEWEETEDGLRIYNTISGAGGAGGTSLFSANNNNANIQNNIEVYALTGDNKIMSEGGNVQAATGDAYTAANIMNIVNTNVVGRNWFSAIFNVFGDWNGNIVFGRPDLWIGGEMTVLDGGHPKGGSELLFTYTIVNKGDGMAPGVIVQDRISKQYMGFLGASDTGQFDSRNGTMRWELGDLLPGEQAIVQYRVVLKHALTLGWTHFTLRPNVSSAEEDINSSDNTEEVIVSAFKDPSEYGNEDVWYTPDPELNVTKRNYADGPIEPGDVVEYEVVVTNDGGVAYHAMLIDEVRSEKGELMSRRSWPLNFVHENEEIHITYSVEFSEETEPGVYTNYAKVKAIGRNPSFNPFYGTYADSNIAASHVEVVADTKQVSKPTVVPGFDPETELTEKVTVEAPVHPEITRILMSMYGSYMPQAPARMEQNSAPIRPAMAEASNGGTLDGILVHTLRTTGNTTEYGQMCRYEVSNEDDQTDNSTIAYFRPISGGDGEYGMPREVVGVVARIATLSSANGATQKESTGLFSGLTLVALATGSASVSLWWILPILLIGSAPLITRSVARAVHDRHVISA